MERDDTKTAEALIKRGVAMPIGGFAPGNYTGSCKSCGDLMARVDKRARECLPCAVASSIATSSAVYERGVKDGRRKGTSEAIETLRGMLRAPAHD